jgi:hypothetical protein
VTNKYLLAQQINITHAPTQAHTPPPHQPFLEVTSKLDTVACNFKLQLKTYGGMVKLGLVALFQPVPVTVQPVKSSLQAVAHASG